jgi:hypothetical protein
VGHSRCSNSQIALWIGFYIVFGAGSVSKAGEFGARMMTPFVCALMMMLVITRVG